MKLPVKMKSERSRLGRSLHSCAGVDPRRLAFTGLALAGLAGCLMVGIALKARSQSGPKSHKRIAHKSSRPLLTGSDGSVTGIADFLGNFTAVTAPSQSYFLIQRQPDCSLTFGTGDSTGTPGSDTVTGTTPHYERVLHQLASLQTTADVFPNGCAETSTGISTRPVLSLGKTPAGEFIFALAKSMVTGTANSDFSTYSYIPHRSIPYASGIVTGDLNGDGNGDVVAVNGRYGVTSAFISVLLGNGDGTFVDPVNYPTGGTSSVAAVLDDVNGDRKLDLVAVSADQQISVLLGNGDGTFQAAKTFAAPALPGQTSAAATPIVNLITADLRGVGKKDVICSNGLVLMGNGDGTFTPTSVPAFPYAQDNLYAEGPNLASGDLNNDGKADLVLGNNSVVSTFIGNGDGTFAAGLSYASIGNTGVVTVSDLDGDGNADIYNGLANGGFYSGDDSNQAQAYVLMGNGNGTFQGAPTLIGPYTGNNLGDVNGDGLPDVITDSPTAFNTPGPTFTVQLGTAKGPFNPVSTITAPASFVLNGKTITGANTTGPGAFAVADINGDSKADLVFADNNLIGNALAVYFTASSNGDGTFAAPVPYAFPQIAPAADYDVALTVSGMQIASLTGSGHNDLIFVFSDQYGGSGVTNPYLGGFAVLPGNGDGTFKAPVVTTTYTSATGPTTALQPQIISTTDFNGDGKTDLLVVVGSFSVATGATSQLELFLGNGDGTFQAPAPIATAANPDINGGAPVPCALADFNKDGKLDIACLGETSASQAQLALSLGNGDGTFAAPTILNVGGGDAIRSSGIGAADFDGDGNVDVALFDANDLSGIFYGKGDGTLTSVPFNGNSIPKDLINLYAGGPTVAADLNHDGKPDLLVGNLVLLNIYGSAPVTPTLAATTTALTASAATITAGGSVSFTATVSGASGSTGVPTGAVTFLDGTTSLGTGTLNGSGVATYSTTALAAAAHSITAKYGGDSNFAASTSAAVIVTVTAIPASFTVSASPASLSIAAGQTGTTTVSVTPTGGFTQAVTFACSGLPFEATCTFAPATVTPTASAVTSTLTITTTAAQAAARNGIYKAGMTGLFALASLLLFGIPRTKRAARWGRWFGLVIALTLGGGLIGCGGGSSGGGGGPKDPGTPSGTSTVTVTASAGSINQTSTLQVTVP